MSNTTDLKPANPYARTAEAVLEPPTDFRGTLRFLGPSFILIGSIVGSGELILTTSFGAHVGFAALWFILLSCVCKTLVQAELGRYTISSGDTCLEAFNRVPGPRWRVSWAVWIWIIWQIPGLIVGGGILGSTGQVLATAFPIMDQVTWALLLAAINVVILLVGKYSFLEKGSTFMVMTFSATTMITAVALQFTPFAVPLNDAIQGLIIDVGPLMKPAVIATTAAAFAATGVSGGELMSYTYWCVEKGYARYAGPREDTDAWGDRALGWVKVMRTDVWLATVIFTATTLAFFWLGAGVLFPRGLAPSDKEMIPVLENIYTQSLGPWARSLFLTGGFFVLYSTIFSGTAGTTRLYADALGVLGLVDFTDFRARLKWIRIFTVAVPVIQALVFASNAKPLQIVIFGSVANGMLIPLIAFITIWLRRHGTDRRLVSGRATDIGLWFCAFVIASVSTVYILTELTKAR